MNDPVHIRNDRSTQKLEVDVEIAEGHMRLHADGMRVGQSAERTFSELGDVTRTAIRIGLNWEQLFSDSLARKNGELISTEVNDRMVTRVGDPKEYSCVITPRVVSPKGDNLGYVLVPYEAIHGDSGRELIGERHGIPSDPAHSDPHRKIVKEGTGELSAVSSTLRNPVGVVVFHQKPVQVIWSKAAFQEAAQRLQIDFGLDMDGTQVQDSDIAALKLRKAPAALPQWAKNPNADRSREIPSEAFEAHCKNTYLAGFVVNEIRSREKDGIDAFISDVTAIPNQTAISITVKLRGSHLKYESEVELFLQLTSPETIKTTWSDQVDPTIDLSNWEV